jgi:DNA invertase Pin-like site-specific DNA recombinase
MPTLSRSVEHSFVQKYSKSCGWAVASGSKHRSSKDQSLALQDAELRQAGCAQVFAEKVSGARTERKELARVLKRLGDGDVLVVTRLDRLAKSTRDLLNIIDAVARAGATFKSIHDAWADTTTPHGKLMLTILGGLAEFERTLILARTAGPDSSSGQPTIQE